MTKEYKIYFGIAPNEYLGIVIIKASTPSKAKKQAKLQLSTMYPGNQFKLFVREANPKERCDTK